MIGLLSACVILLGLGSPPENASDYIRLAENSIRTGDHEKALSSYGKAFELDRDLPPHHYYNAAYSAAASNDPDKSLFYLYKRLEADKEWYTESLKNDEAFNVLHSDSRWGVLMDSLERRRLFFERDFDHALRKELNDIISSDQSVRQEYVKERNNPSGDSGIIDSLITAMLHTDSVNLARVREIVDTRGWPRKENVGGASAAVFLVLQHAPHDIQKMYVDSVRLAAERGDISKSNYAMFIDRVAVVDGQEQIYGTQIIYDDDGNPVLAPLRDPGNVNERRREAGLGPIEDYLKRWGIEFKP